MEARVKWIRFWLVRSTYYKSSTLSTLIKRNIFFTTFLILCHSHLHYDMRVMQSVQAGGEAVVRSGLVRKRGTLQSNS